MTDCPAEKHVGTNGEFITTCCRECQLKRRRTPCTACVEKGSGGTDWQQSYVDHAEDRARDLVPRKE